MICRLELTAAIAIRLPVRSMLLAEITEAFRMRAEETALVIPARLSLRPGVSSAPMLIHETFRGMPYGARDSFLSPVTVLSATCKVITLLEKSERPPHCYLGS